MSDIIEILLLATYPLEYNSTSGPHTVCTKFNN